MSKYKNCPSCGAVPDQLKCPGVRYSHNEKCQLGRVQLNPGKEGYKYGGKCNKCYTNFTLKIYDNPGDSHTKECPICWANEESKK